MAYTMRGFNCSWGEEENEENIDPRLLRKRKVTEMCYLGSQPHLLYFFHKLNEEEQDKWLSTLESVDFKELRVSFLVAHEIFRNRPSFAFSPPKVIDTSKADTGDASALTGLPLCSLAKLKSTHPDVIDKWHNRGLELIGGGKIAVVLLAGGQGTRLGFDAPKGCYKIGPMSKMTLFELVARRIRTLQQMAGEPIGGRSDGINLYIMVSAQNHDETKKFFDNTDVGLPRSRIHLFLQPEIPSFNKKGKMVLESMNKLAMSPNGNGGVFEALKSSGTLDQMRKSGVEGVHVVAVDNALSRVADPVFMGFAEMTGAEVVNKCVEKSNPDERVGMFCLKKQVVEEEKGAEPKPEVCSVVEYTELSEEMRNSKTEDNSALMYSSANICSHYFRLDFIKRVSGTKQMQRKYHVAHKKVTCIDMDEMDDHFPFLLETPVTPENPNVFKLEAFIFDSFEIARSVVGLEVSRESEFAPVKDAEGVDSPATAQTMMSQLHQDWLKKAGFQFDPPEAVASNKENFTCEVSPDISYGGENLVVHNKGVAVKLPFYLK